MDTYGSHIPVLAVALTLSKGPIVEFGAGDYSTLLLDLHSRATGREVLTLETDFKWMHQFVDMSQSNPKHQFLHVPISEANPAVWDTEMTAGSEPWEQCTAIDAQHWGLAFIDHRPGWRRKIDIVRMLHKADVVVVHDTEEAGYNYEPALKLYKYRVDYKRVRPWTTIVSNAPIPLTL